MIELLCQHYPDCDYVDKYLDLLANEEKCYFQKIKCPNYCCKFQAKFWDLKNHLLFCEYSNIQFSFCKAIIIRAEIASHLEKHKKNNNFYIKPCYLCNSDQDIRRCLCNECICANCLEENDISSHRECFALGVHWIRVGITFEPKIA